MSGIINAKGSSAAASGLPSRDCGCRRGRFLVAPDRVHERAAGPKVLPDDIAFALSINPGHGEASVPKVGLCMSQVGVASKLACGVVAYPSAGSATPGP